MNVTVSIANTAPIKVRQIILQNSEIQFYANDNINEYQWRDNRYAETQDMWGNKSAKTRKELIEIFAKHLVDKGEILTESNQ